MLNTLKDHLLHAARTVCGFYLHPFSKAWDEELNHILDCGAILRITECTITIFTKTDVVEIWIANQWHACAHVHLINGIEVPKNWVRPRFRTMRRLYALIQEHAGQ